MKIEKPGLLRERMASGNIRYRVRVAKDKTRRIRLHVAPDHPDFEEHYLAARRGVEMKPDRVSGVYGSLEWLGRKYIRELERRVGVGQMSAKTLKKKKQYFKTLVTQCGEFAITIPALEIVHMRDRMAATPAAADGFVSFMRTMFDWALAERLCSINPAQGIGTIDKGKGGATPWSIEDLKQFRDHHGESSPAYICLTLLMFSGCRIGDAALLGRGNEKIEGGIRWVGWQPQKKNSAYVKIPMIEPLYLATRVSKVQGKTYVLTQHGRSFASGDSLSHTFIKWCIHAGLENRSAHGVRKATGHLLAQMGCSQYQIMAIHGHTEAQTSEVYTKGVERQQLAQDAMAALATIEW